MAQCLEASQEEELVSFSSSMSCVMFSTKRKKDSVIGGFGILEGKEFNDEGAESYMLDSQCVFAKSRKVQFMNFMTKFINLIKILELILIKVVQQ